MHTARGRKTLFVTLLTAAILVTGCGAEEETQDDRADKQNTQEQTAERTEERNRDKERTKEDTRVEKKGDKDKGSGGEVALEIGGDPGTAFSGVCSVGDEENEIGGEVPESFSYELGGRQLECEIRKEGTDSGALKVLLTGPGDRIEQQINSPGGAINLVYSENGVSSSTSSSGSSSGSSSSVNQVVSSSSSSGSE